MARSLREVEDSWAGIWDPRPARMHGESSAASERAAGCREMQGAGALPPGCRLGSESWGSGGEVRW